MLSILLYGGILIATIIILLTIFLIYKFITSKFLYTPKPQLLNYNSLNNSASFEKKATLSIFNLHGSYEEMGEQYGALAYNQLNEIYQQIVPLYFNSFKWTTLLAYYFKRSYQKQLDPREINILKGMAKTSGLTYKQLLSIEMLPMLITLFNGLNGDKLIDTKGTGHCSFLSIWGQLSSNNNMLIARNLDLSTAVTKLDSYYNLVIYNPSNNDSSVATFGFIGFIPGFSWISQNGLFSEYNDGRRSVPGLNSSGFIGLNSAFYAMLSSKTSAEFIDYIQARPAFISNFTAIVNTTTSHTIEHAANSQFMLLDGQSANANYFTNLYRTNFVKAKITLSNCIEKIKDTPSYAAVRYRHIEEFLQKSPIIGLAELKDFFSRSLDDGGVYQTGQSSNYPVAEVTNYTLIGDLVTGQYIYSNHADKNNWVELNINNYFTIS